MSPAITPNSKSLLVFILAVGDGDSIIVQLPETDEYEHMVIDCKRADPTKNWLSDIEAQKLALVVATHPHYDHIAGLKSVMKMFTGNIDQFWDSGFRSNLVTWHNLMQYISDVETGALFMRPTSGMYTTFNGVDITVLAPSIYLRNRYDSYGVNINNASIVLKLDYAGKSIILAGDAQWDSWGKITEEFPRYVETDNPDQHIQIDTPYNPLKSDVLKVAHHGSKHGTSLEPIEVLDPKYAIITCAKVSSYGFPHKIALMSLEEKADNILDTASCNDIMIEIEDSGRLNVYKDVIASGKNNFTGVKC